MGPTHVEFSEIHVRCHNDFNALHIESENLSLLNVFTACKHTSCVYELKLRLAAVKCFNK